MFESGSEHSTKIKGSKEDIDESTLSEIAISVEKDRSKTNVLGSTRSDVLGSTGNRTTLDVGQPNVDDHATGNPSLEKRQPKLSEKGKAYRLSELERQRKLKKRELQTLISNIRANMDNETNLQSVKQGMERLNILFKQFQDLHENVLVLLTEEERTLEARFYQDLCREMLETQTLTTNWITEVNARNNDKRSLRSKGQSAKSKKTTKGSMRSRSSTSSIRLKLIEARAKQQELHSRVSSMDKIEDAAERARKADKDVERARLIADYEAALAVTKVYEEAERDSDQDLGSDDPDNETEHADLPGLKENKDDKIRIDEQTKNLKTSLPPKEPLAFKPPCLKDIYEQTPIINMTNLPKLKTSTPCDAKPITVPRMQQDPKQQLHVEQSPKPKLSSGTLLTPHQFLEDKGLNSRLTSTPQRNGSLTEPPTTLWEKMELRMSQPPPKPTPFDGDPARYLKFRSNFRDQVESKPSLTDSERMSYLMTYTTGKARQAIEYYEGLPNGCQLALNVLEQRFGQSAMIVQALKSSVIQGPKLKAYDSAGLLAFSDKLENCYWSMVELNSAELDCTTNLKLIYDRLPDSLQRKWRNEAKLYRLRSHGREPSLKELCAFIASEAQTENDPVYGVIDNKAVMQEKSPINRVKRFTPQKSSVKLPTLAINVQSANKESTQDNPHDEDNDNCKVCKKGKHKVSACPAFSEKGVNWRRRFARFNKLCYLCLSTQHIRSNCQNGNGCQVKDCSSPTTHHTLLHVERKDNSSWTGCTTTGINNHATSAMSRRGFVMLKVVPMRVVAKDGNTVTTYGLLDSAAVATMINSKLARKLKLEGSKENLNINTVVQRNHECLLPNVEFAIAPTTRDQPRFEVHRALVMEDLNIPEQYRPNQLNLSSYPHLEDLDIPNMNVDLDEVSILVGQDVPQAHVVLEYCWGQDPSNQPYGMKTPFAWCVAGPTCNKDVDSKPVALSVFGCFERNIERPDVTLNQQVEKFWSLENHGFGDSNQQTDSIEDARALHMLEESTQSTDAGYKVGLLWKHDNPSLPNNRKLAERRLKQLERRFQRDEDFAEKYERVIKDYLEKGYAKKLSDTEAEKTSDVTWYLPHHGVVNPNKSKIRVVYDAAAEYKGVSLNKELLQGPQLNNNLLGVLLRFRKETIALTSDIESMFHRVHCAEEDTDALRFLWWSEGFDKPPSEHKMMVHLFGKSDSPCIAAWALKKTAKDHEHEFGKEVSHIVDRNFYVDDCLVSVTTPEKAIELSKNLTELLKKGNFRLTKFASNDKTVLAAIPAEERTIKNLDLDEVPIERALGVQWNIETDTLGVKQSPTHGEVIQDTRRECLSVLSSTFDPLGITAPVLLTAKRVIQRTWQLKLGWDDILPDDLLDGWQNWKEDLAILNHVKIPRCYFENGCYNASTLQLHHFSDASEIGYGTVTYLRKESADGSIECAFVMSKSRTTPLQYISIPRLELQAATIAVRVNNLILREIDLRITDTFFWTDSKLTLQYIYNECRRFKTYVANRVAEIRDSTEPRMWRHCPGELNPADDASRGLSPKEILNKKRWLHGPSFLLQPESEWPREDVGELPDDEPEVKLERPIFTVTAPTSLQALLTRYSSWSTLLRKVAWLLKFKKYLQYRHAGKQFSSDDKKISTDDLESATIAVVKAVQHQAYKEEINDLKKNQMIKKNSSLVKLHPVLMEEIMRVGGRIVDAAIPFQSKCPMILPPGHHVTQLLIAHYHQKLAHAGQDHILAQLREKFWIPKGRSAVRKVVRACLSCKKYNAVRMEQMMASLPAFRMTAFEPCFTHTGVDYFGPLNVKRGRSQVKRWGAIFTCLNSRAVHLELASSLETDCFINLLRRFINRRGPPRFIYSDNGTNFVGAERELKTAIQNWNQVQIDKELLQKGIQWVFQPPKASHASGVWERLIRSTRKALKAILKERSVDEEVLTTVLTEVEAILNSRPLCAASDDPKDCEPLTPNHLLLQRPMQALPPGTFVKEDIYCRKKWKQVQILANHFWTRWLHEYLPALQERQKWHRPRRNAQIGDLVLLVDESLPRGKWPLGRIVSTRAGRDGLVRTVEVKTQTSTLQRPIQKLCLLEEASTIEDKKQVAS